MAREGRIEVPRHERHLPKLRADDLSQIHDADQLHDLLQAALALPPCYGRNLDALDEWLGAPPASSLPDELRGIGHDALAARLPRDARLWHECLEELGERGRRCRVEWAP